MPARLPPQAMVVALHLPRLGASSERSYVLEGIRKKDQGGHSSLPHSRSVGAELGQATGAATAPEGAAPVPGAGAKAAAAAAAGDDWVINIAKKEAAAAAYGRRTT